MPVKANVDISIKIDPASAILFTFSDTRSLKRVPHWPDEANFFVLMLCFVFTQRKRTQAKEQAQEILPSACVASENRALF